MPLNSRPLRRNLLARGVSLCAPVRLRRRELRWYWHSQRSVHRLGRLRPQDPREQRRTVKSERGPANAAPGPALSVAAPARDTSRLILREAIWAGILPAARTAAACPIPGLAEPLGREHSRSGAAKSAAPNCARARRLALRFEPRCGHRRADGGVLENLRAHGPRHPRNPASRPRAPNPGLRCCVPRTLKSGQMPAGLLRRLRFRRSVLPLEVLYSGPVVTAGPALRDLPAQRRLNPHRALPTP